MYLSESHTPGGTKIRCIIFLSGGKFEMSLVSVLAPKRVFHLLGTFHHKRNDVDINVLFGVTHKQQVVYCSVKAWFLTNCLKEIHLIDFPKLQTENIFSYLHIVRNMHV